MNDMVRGTLLCAVLALPLLLTGCWESDNKDLIPDDKASNPFDGAQFILYRDARGEKSLLERRAGKYESFTRFDPEYPIHFKFFEIADFASWFGPDKYLVGADGYYAYYEQDGDEWTEFSLGGARRQARTLDDLIAQVQDARKSGKLKPGGMLKAEAVDSGTAALFKRTLLAEHEKKKQLEALKAREEAVRLREQQLREQEQKLLAEANERAAKVNANLAATEDLLAQAAAAAKIFEDDREPTEDEMSTAIRGTIGGALFNVSVRKLGGCRQMAAYDYVCRYRWLSVNWGNFWKENGKWSFQIVK